MARFEALYGRKCRTLICWSELDEALPIGPKVIQDTTKMIRKIQGHIEAT